MSVHHSVPLPVWIATTVVPRITKTTSTPQAVLNENQEIILAVTGSQACIPYAQMPESFLDRWHHPESNACTKRHSAMEEKSLPNAIMEAISLHVLIMSDRITRDDICDTSDLCPSENELACESIA